MTPATKIPDEAAFTIGGKTYREAADYLASLVAYARQQAARSGDRLPVEMVASGLSQGDARALQ